MRRIPRRTALLLLLLPTLLCALATGQEAKKPKKVDRAKLEKQFAETLTGSVLAGNFSVIKEGEEKAGSKDRYTITQVKKLQGDLWLFTTRIQYGDKDVQVPIPLVVKWAGDTPVITLTDLTVPGLGTFTARILIYRNQYAGTWQHGKVGGNMWGRIEKAKPKEDAKKDEKKKKPVDR